ncbi:MAG: Holliday junction branch migration protein RuvA [Alphaproteobacteria bacterium]|nr:Holliday junction branch migration protein RuvA [Alphaproteobacteria bacterium]
MIGKLTGAIDSVAEGYFILDVQGVGYLVHASRRTLARLGQRGEVAAVLIDTAVREDAITLYGFIDAAEQQWFRLLTSVQGVGAKAGMSILSVCPPDKIGLAIAAQDKAVLTQADGVGPKLAVRILTELKDKAVNLQGIGNVTSLPSRGQGDSGLVEGVGALDQDAISALVNLGYARADAYTAVLRAREKANDNLQSLIKEALKELSQ